MMATVHLCSYHCLIKYDSESVCVFFQGMSAGRRRDIHRGPEKTVTSDKPTDLPCVKKRSLRAFRVHTTRRLHTACVCMKQMCHFSHVYL